MEIRPMTFYDIDEVVQIHLRAFKGYMNASLGKNYVCKFLNWFITSKISTAFVVTDENKVIGYVVGATIGYDAELNRELLKTGIYSIITHPKIFFHRHFIETIKVRLKMMINEKKLLIKVNNEPSGKGISLVGIAVDPLFSRKGCGTLLMQSFENSAKNLGYKYMRLSVYDVNEKARILYSKNGWKVLKIDGAIIYYYKEI